MRSATTDGAQTFGTAQSDGLWLKDQNGWRWQWVVTGLSPQTNYTVYSITDSTHVAGPINFVTKSGVFMRFSPVMTLTLPQTHSHAQLYILSHTARP